MQLSPPPTGTLSQPENPNQKKRKRRWNKKLLVSTEIQLVQSSPCPPLRKRNKSPGVRIRGGRIFDSRNGKTCHQCRQKTMDVVAACKSQRDDKSCTIMFCQKCLLNRYGERTDEANQMDGWKCPKCRGCCNCSFCMKKRGHKPTGILVHAAKATGFRSVLEMLTVRGPETISSLRKKEKPSNGKDDSIPKWESFTPPRNDKNVKRNKRKTIDIEGTKAGCTQLKKGAKQAYLSNEINLSVIESEERRNEMVDTCKKKPIIRQNFVEGKGAVKKSNEWVDCGENMFEMSQNKLERSPWARNSEKHYVEFLDNSTTGVNMFEGRKDDDIQSKKRSNDTHMIVISQVATTSEYETKGKRLDCREEAPTMRKNNMKKLARAKGYINGCNNGSQSKNNVEKPYILINMSDAIQNQKKKNNGVDGVDVEEHKIIRFCKKTTLDSLMIHERLSDNRDSQIWIPEEKSTDLIKKEEETAEKHIDLTAPGKNGRKDIIVDGFRPIANCEHKTECDTDKPLPQEVDITTMSNRDLPAEDALQFLEFCNAFGEELLSKAIQDKQVLEPNPCVSLEALASWCNIDDMIS